VAEGRLDLGVCSPPPPELGLVFRPLFAEEMGLLVPARHALAKARRVRARDLLGHRLLLTEQGCAYREAIARSMAGAGAPVECDIEIGSVSGLVAAVRQGLGVAIVPTRSARPLPAGTRLRHIDDANVALPVGLVRREDGVPATPAVAAFAEALAAGLPGPNRSRPARLLE
jgi:DNA-binding transcriptional LysR family regulator